MPIWNKSRMTTFYYGTQCADEHPCTVRIADGKLVVEYDGRVQYTGLETGTGHFILVKTPGTGTATLHMAHGSNILEGYWIEESYRGMWRIELLDED